MQLDEVHGGHGEAGAIHEAANVAVKRDVVDAELMSEPIALFSYCNFAHESIVNYNYNIFMVIVYMSLGCHHDQRFFYRGSRGIPPGLSSPFPRKQGRSYHRASVQ